jgi:hypothetical protein
MLERLETKLRTRKALPLLAAALSLALAPVALAKVEPDPPNGLISNVGVRGEIRSFERGGEGKVTAKMLVVGKLGPGVMLDRAVVRTTAETIFHKRKDGKVVPASLKDLRKGGKVEVRFTGPILKSYPAQATASHVMILKR